MEQLLLEGTAAAVRVLPDDAFAALAAPLAAALRARGFDALTPVQQAILDADTAGRDLAISSRTGSGKTVGLGLALAPGLLEREREAEARRRGPLALIVVPTRELAAQLREELSWLYAGIERAEVECVTGGTSAWQERTRLARRPAVVVGTPGRLLDHIGSGALSCDEVRELVLDEADQMLDMGFREELDAIVAATPAERRTHLVSATFPAGILQLAARHQREPQRIEVAAPSQGHEDIEQIAHVVTPQSRYAALVNLLLLADGERALVFLNTRADAARVAEQLAGDGFRAQVLSGELQQSQRTSVLAAFRAGSISVLVATDVAARGLDVPEVALVVHAAAPSDADAYVHRSGRTGRAGRKGRSVLLAQASKERALRRMLGEAGLAVDWQPLPDAKAVQKQLVKAERRRVFAAVDAEPGPSAEQLDFARRLIEARDPARVVAVLLAESRTRIATEARDVGAPPPPLRPERDRDGGGGAERSFGRLPRRPGANGRSAARNGAPRVEGAQRFAINWGSEGGATPPRILAHVCRRGGIAGHHVGAIRTGPRTSTFEVAAEIASSFESRVRGRDSRDPKLRIVRAR